LSIKFMYYVNVLIDLGLLNMILVT
jgi:hypothetical protein